MTNQIAKHLDPPGSDASTDIQGTARSEVTQRIERLQDFVRHAFEKSGKFVAAHPCACLGAAAVAGIILGWWVKRK